MKRLSHFFFFAPLLFTATAFAQTTPSILAVVDGAPQTTKVRTQFPAPIRVSLKDPAGDALTTVPVLFTAPSTGPSLNSITVAAITNGDGIASLNATANTQVGTYTVLVSYPGASSLSIQLTNLAGDPFSIVATGGTPQSAEAGGAFPARLEVTVRDEFLNLVSGATVTFTSVRTSNARATFPNGNQSTTDANGNGGVVARAGSSPGSYVVRATSGSATPALFNLTNTAPTTLFAPALFSGNATQLGIAWTNPLDKSVTLSMTARSNDGQLISGSGIQNPAQVPVAARSQVARQATEIFGPGIADRTGWVEVKVSDPAGGGLFLLFDNQLSTVDGGLLLNAPAPRLFFPHVNKDTILHVVNTGNTTILPASVAVYSDSGVLVGSATVPIQARGGWTGKVTELVPGAASTEGYSIVDTQGSPFATRVPALVGIATYQLGGDLAVESAQDDSTLLTTGYAVHVISGGGYSSRVRLANPSTQQQQVQLSFNGVTVQRFVPGQGRLNEPLSQLFGISPNVTATGVLKIQTVGDTAGVAGYVEIISAAGILLTAEAFSAEPQIQHVFSHVAHGSGYWTGLALFNPDAETANVTIELNSVNGTVVASKAITIGPNQRLIGLLSDLIPEAPDQLGGSLRVISSRPIFSLEIVSSADQSGGNFMANIPTAIY